MDLSPADLPFFPFFIAVFATVGIGVFIWRKRVLTRMRTIGIFLSVVFSLLCAIVLMLYPGVLDPRYAAYQGFYRDIRIGMTRTEVFETMKSHYPGEGPRRPPRALEEAGELLFFMNCEGTEGPNCEAIALSFDSDRVTKKEYTAD